MKRGRRAGPGDGVLITGCSSGIGRATAIALARAGFTVYATVRKAADAESLRGLGEPGLGAMARAAALLEALPQPLADAVLKRRF